MGSEAEKAGMVWTVYVLVSNSSSRSYVGITKDLDRRLQQHNGELPGGARTTTHGRPWRVGVQYGPFDERGEAQRVEYEVKKRRGADRLVWESGAGSGNLDRP